jgi:hypothetical protein
MHAVLVLRQRSGASRSMASVRWCSARRSGLECLIKNVDRVQRKVRRVTGGVAGVAGFE